MKLTTPELAAAFTTSHARVVHVYVHAQDGTRLGRLPVIGGTVRASAGYYDRWTATVELAGLDWVPTYHEHPLSGFDGAYCEVYAGAVVNRAESTIRLARLWPYRTRFRRARDTLTVTLDLVGPAAYASQAAGRAHAPTPNESCQGMIRRLLAGPGVLPHDPAVTDTTTAVPVPADYTSDRDVWATVEDLAAYADVAVYFDADGDLIIRPPLSAGPTPTDRALSAAVEVTGYETEVGRDLVANDVSVTFTDDLTGRAQVTAGPLAVTGPAGRITATYRAEIAAGNQARADAAARSYLEAARAAWATVDVEHAPDPRLEPDDPVTLTYYDGTTTLHRVVSVDYPLGDGVARLTARTLDPPDPAAHKSKPHASEIGV